MNLRSKIVKHETHELHEKRQENWQLIKSSSCPEPNVFGSSRFKIFFVCSMRFVLQSLEPLDD